MSQTSSPSFFDRPSLALRNLLEGDLEATGRSLLAPMTLSPEESRTLADDWGVAQGPSPYDMALRAISNPAVLIGAVLALRYPIPLARDMWRGSALLRGYTNRVGPFMRNVGSLVQIYDGTKVPAYYKQLVREVDTFRRTYMERLGQAITEAQTAGLPWNARTRTLISAKLDGLDTRPILGMGTLLRPIQEGPTFNRLISSIRQIQDDLWDKFFRSPPLQAELSGKALKRYKNMRNSALRNVFIEPLKKRAQYLPHMMARSQRGFEQQLEKLITSGERATIERTARGAATIAPPSALPALGRMVPDPADLQQISEYLRPGALQKISSWLQIEGRRRYTLNFNEVFPAWIQSLALTHGWSIAKAPDGVRLGRGLLREVELLARTDPVRAMTLKESYIPMALGRTTFAQSQNALRWADTKLKFANWLTKDPLALKTVPPTMRDWLLKSLGDPGKLGSLQGLGGRAAGYLYLSSLGLNAPAAARNLLQLILTTVPTIGPGYTWRGLNRLIDKAPRYFQARSAGKLHEEALGLAFPEYKTAGLTASPLLEEALGQGLRRAWGSVGEHPIASRVKGALMALFTASENIVRLGTFEGAMAKATSEGLSTSKAISFATRVVEETQFLAGPAHVPGLVKSWNPVLRQFTQFPLHMLRFLGGTSLEMGLGTPGGTGFLARNWGGLGRTLLASSLTYEAGREFLDMDLSRGLLWGALPTPHPESPFAPLPMVPPAIGLAGAAAQDLLQGEFKQTGYSLPLLVPGGQGLAKLTPWAAPSVARFLGKPYVGYENKRPDGRYPVYTPTGQLIGFQTPWEIYSSSFGFGGALQKEKTLLRYFLAQRDRIRVMRRDYLDALTSGEVDRAQELREDFKSAYPMIPDIQIQNKDLRAIDLRKNISRLERTLETLPREVRSSLGGLIATQFSELGEQFIGIDPLLLQEFPTIRSRDSWRESLPQDPLRRLMSGRQLLRDYQRDLPWGISNRAKVPLSPPGTLQQSPPSSSFGIFSGFGF